LIKNFLVWIGIDILIAEDTGKILAHLFEYDEAYKYPLQDALTDIDWTGNLRKEINKAIRRLGSRWHYAEVTFGWLDKPALILLHPKFKKAFKQAVDLANTNNLKLLEADYYFCILRSEYKYRGRTYEERLVEWDSIHDGKPPIQYKIDIT
jgi:hypothetical protein